MSIERVAVLSGRAGWTSFGCALIVTVVVFALGVASPLPADDGRAQAADTGTSGEMRPSEATSGTLLFRSGTGRSGLPAPLLDTDVVIRVSGMVARATVRQTFGNPYDAWYEGIYVFPLPENAAVDHLKMRIGERVVDGEIRERAAAKKEYEQAKSNGQRAALLEQERPNIFTSSVANIGPREQVVVEIEYQQTLRYDAGRFSLRFPMVVGPRYVPGRPVPGRGAGNGAHGWAADTDVVPDASRITPPVLRPESGDINPVSIRVELDAGAPVAQVASAYHAITRRSIDDRNYIVELRGGVTPANRDFELWWEPVRDAAPRTAWFTEKVGESTYGLLMVMPPAASTRGRRLPREIVFVIDTSGSMSGTSIVQARQALELAIDRIQSGDRFNVIEFNSSASALFPTAQPASKRNREHARRWVINLQAQGGTEMARALDLALDGEVRDDRVRQIVFLTDAAVGNEDELFRLINERLGDSRLFTVGIGSAPNGHFMTRAAEVGRGTFTYIGNVEEVGEKMGALFAKLESPVLKNVRIEWPRGVTAEAWPARIPDLYSGEPLVVTVALSRDGHSRLRGDARVSGVRGDAPWQSTIPVHRDTGSAGVAVLWAREKIDSLIDARLDGADEEQTRLQVTQIALRHHLVSKYTSLVAIDRTPVRPVDAALRTGAMPTNLPQGWNYDAVFGAGELPQGATDSRFNLLVGTVLLMLGALLLLLRRKALACERA